MLNVRYLNKLLLEQKAELHKMQDVYVRCCSKEQAETPDSMEFRIEIAKTLGGIIILQKLIKDAED